MLSLEDIATLFAAKGGRAYTGEPVTQLEHALQSATLAHDEGADAALICAALLHDLGHLLNDQGETPTERGVDDLHQYVVLPFLRGLFGDAVLEPIKLHVAAKRYLCQAQAGYLQALSPDSQRSLALQGGVYTADAAATFMNQPHAAAALRLRLWDDRAKVVGMKVYDLAFFKPILQSATLASLD